MTEPADRPVGRIRFMDQQRVNLDGFASRTPTWAWSRCVPARSRAGAGDPRWPGRGDGRRRGADFDSLDAYIARHGLDLAVAAEAMALTTSSWPGSRSTPTCPRAEVVRLARGTTPAKLARVLGPAEAGRAEAGHDQAAGPPHPRATRRTSPTGSTTRCCSPPTRPRRPRSASGRSRRPCPCSPTRRRTPSPARRRGGRVAGRAHPVLGRGGAGARARHARADLPTPRRSPSTAPSQVFIDGDDTPWSKAIPDLRVRLARDEDAGHLGRRGRGADGRGRGQLHALPGVALRLAGPRDGRPGRAERRHRRRQRGRLGARRA